MRNRERNESVEGVIRLDGTTPFSIAEASTSVDGAQSEEEMERRLADLQRELRELQELMFASEVNGVLVILQGMDAAGKDVSIQQVFATATAEAMRAVHFTSMTEEEAAHDFLWRVHREAPKRGELVIFDRSYYEQLVNPLVQGEHDEDQFREHAEDVVAFERILQRGGAIVIKVLLHVGAQEQERRLWEREENDETAWKISANDWISRTKWDSYMAAFERVVNATATRTAPWHIVPADHELFHNLAVADLLVSSLRPYREEWLRERTRIGTEKRAEAQQARKDSAA